MPKTIDLVTEIPGPRAKAILERKTRVVADPLDIHVPTVIDHATGARIVDVDGNTWLDFSSGLGAQMVGYSHPKVVEAVRRQADGAGPPGRRGNNASQSRQRGRSRRLESCRG